MPCISLIYMPMPYRGRDNKGHLGGLDKLFKIRDRHHTMRHQILSQNEGPILILAQTGKFSLRAILYLILGLSRAFKALRALKGPQIKFSHIIMQRPYRDLQNLKFSRVYPFPFSHKVVPQKASGRVWGAGLMAHSEKH